MPAFDVPKGEVLEILDALGIERSGWAVKLRNDDVIVLLHYKTHLEVSIRKGVKRTWL